MHEGIRQLKKGSLIIIKRNDQVSWALVLGRNPRKRLIQVSVINWKVDKDSGEIRDQKNWNTEIKYSLMSEYLETAQVFP